MSAEPWRENCWCPGERTLLQMRIAGHTEACSQAIRGWRMNAQHLSELDREKRLDREVGRQIREAALLALNGGRE